MFASKVDLYNTEDVLGGPEGSRTATTPSTRSTSTSPSCRSCAPSNPALADGAQVNRFAADGAGIFATSRRRRHQGGKQVEYVVVANNSDTKAATATFPTWTKGNGAVFTPVFGTDTAVKPAADGSVKVTVPPLTVSVWRANKPISDRRCGADRRDRARRRRRVRPHRGQGRRAGEHLRPDHVPVAQGGRRRRGSDLGTDDNAPFRVFHDVSGIPLARRSSTARSSRTPRAASPATRPRRRWSAADPDRARARRPGRHPARRRVACRHAQQEMGCAADWHARLRRRPS